MKSAEEMRKIAEAHGGEIINGYTIEDMYERQNKAIKREAESGNRRTLFEVHETIYDVWEGEMRRTYEELGYRFENVGMINGVWQKDIYICWQISGGGNMSVYEFLFLATRENPYRRWH